MRRKREIMFLAAAILCGLFLGPVGADGALITIGIEAVVDEVIWASGGLQLGPGGKLPTGASLKGSDLFAVRMRLKSEDPDHPLRFGATGLAAMYTGMGPSVFKLLRQLEIRSESWLFYLYNPF
jgi:hypothetical protein